MCDDDVWRRLNECGADCVQRINHFILYWTLACIGETGMANSSLYAKQLIHLLLTHMHVLLPFNFGVHSTRHMKIVFRRFFFFSLFQINIQRILSKVNYRCVWNLLKTNGLNVRFEESSWNARKYWTFFVCFDRFIFVAALVFDSCSYSRENCLRLWFFCRPITICCVQFRSLAH